MADLTNAVGEAQGGHDYAGSFLEEFVDGARGCTWTSRAPPGTSGREYVGKGPTASACGCSWTWGPLAGKQS